MPYYESLCDGPVQVEPLGEKGEGHTQKYRVVNNTKHYDKNEVLEIIPIYVWDTVKLVGHRYVYERKAP